MLWSTAYGGVLRYLGWSSVKASGTLTSVHIYTHTYVRRSVWIYTPRNPQFSYSNFGGTHSITRQERMKPKNNTPSSPVQAVTRNSLVPNFTNNCFFNFLHLLILLCASFQSWVSSGTRMWTKKSDARAAYTCKKGLTSLQIQVAV